MWKYARRWNSRARGGGIMRRAVVETGGRIARFLGRPVALVVGIVAGGVLCLVAAAAVYVGAAATGTNEFCTSCHSMRTPYDEYRRSAHYLNRSGMRAGCSDCHVPKHPLPFVAAKIAAARDLWGEIVGTLSTEEKFAARKLALAQRVWTRMEASDSRECRSCHDFDAMKNDLQSQKTRNRHPKAIIKGETCIVCHKAVVHSRPDMGPLTEQARAEIVKTIGRVPAGSGVVRTLQIKQLFTAAAADEAVGRVLPGAEMKLLGIDGVMAHVRLSGWRQEGSERVLYAAPGKRILMVSLASGFLDRLDTAGNPITIEATGQVWSPATFEAFIPVAEVTADTDRVWDFASALFSVNCAMCHAAPHVVEYGANEWLGQFRSMVEQTNLDRDERALVQTWLQLHGRDAEGEAAH
jgi:trimethylamine-N-oxide reductase cytochrome c-type subunit TorC